MKTISFKTTNADCLLIVKIVQRAEKMDIAGRDIMACDMDVTACHCNGNKLDLAALLQADDFNFAHDVCGIRRHIDRETGELEDCFVPRFSVK